MAKERSSAGFLDRFNGGGKKSTPAATAEAPAAATPKERKQVDLPGTDLATMADKQEGLLERVMAGRGVSDPVSAKADLGALNGVLTGLSQKTVIVIFAMGKILAEVKEALPHGNFIPWVEGNCPFPRSTASNYMRVFERYRDEPRRALAELSITEAYLEAGVKKLAAPEAEEEPARPKGTPTYDVDEWKDWRSVFKTPPASGVTLKRHRVVPYQDGRLFVVREETGPVPAVNLFADMSIPDPSYQDALQVVHQNLQMALEIFYAKVEELEDQGVLSAPFDSSRPAMAKRMRNVTPEKKASVAKKVPVTRTAKKLAKKPAAKKAEKGARK